MNLDIKLYEKIRDMPALKVDLTDDNNSGDEQLIYDAIGQHLSYLNELVIGLGARVQASLRRMDLMEGILK